jgi:pantetheine-phosphate adenylyltransferase
MAVERTGVYPGTFDPITSGHMEIVRRSLRLVDRLVIGPAINIGKGPLFSLQERIDIIKDDIADMDLPQSDKDRIDVVPFEGLLIHFARG